MAFKLKIYTDDGVLKERFDLRRDAHAKAIEIMDAGVYFKTTRRGNDVLHDVYKTTVASSRGKMLYVNTGVKGSPDEYRFDGVKEEAALKVVDDKVMIEKRRVSSQ